MKNIIHAVRMSGLAVTATLAMFSQAQAQNSGYKLIFYTKTSSKEIVEAYYPTYDACDAARRLRAANEKDSTWACRAA